MAANMDGNHVNEFGYHHNDIPAPHQGYTARGNSELSYRPNSFTPVEQKPRNANSEPFYRTTEDASSPGWFNKTQKKLEQAEKLAADLNSQVKQLSTQLQELDASSTKKLRDLQTSFTSLRLEQTQFADYLAKYERQGTGLKTQQENYNREATGKFDQIRRDIVSDQVALSHSSRDAKFRLDQLDTDKALIGERIKHLREDLERASERLCANGGEQGLYLRETDLKLHNMEVDLKRLQAESSQQGKLLFGTACGAVAVVAYLLATRVSVGARL